MSNAKRDNSEYRYTAAHSAPLRPGPSSATLQPTPTAAALRVVSPWESRAEQGRDPYNAVGVGVDPRTGKLI